MSLWTRHLLQLWDLDNDRTGACTSWLPCWGEHTTPTRTIDPKDLPKDGLQTSLDRTVSLSRSMEDDLSDYSERSPLDHYGRPRTRREARRSRKFRRSRSHKQRVRESFCRVSRKSVVINDESFDYSFNNSILLDGGTLESPSRTDPDAAAAAVLGSEFGSLKESHLQDRAVLDTWPVPLQSSSPPPDWRELLDMSFLPLNLSFQQANQEETTDQTQLPDQAVKQIHKMSKQRTQETVSCHSPSNPQVPKTQYRDDRVPSPPDHRISARSHAKAEIPWDQSSSTELDETGKVATDQALRTLARLCRRLDVPNSANKLLTLQEAPNVLIAVMNEYALSKSVHIRAFRIIITMAQHSPSFCERAMPTPPYSNDTHPNNQSVLACVLSGMRVFPREHAIQVHGTGVLIMLLRRSAQDHCHALVHDHGGVHDVISAMRTFPESRDLQELGLMLLALLCEHSSLRVPVVKAGGLRVADTALQNHNQDVPICLLAQRALAKFCEQKHLYNDDGEQTFGFYQDMPAPTEEPRRETRGERNVPVGVPVRPTRRNDTSSELALTLVKALLQSKA